MKSNPSGPSSSLERARELSRRLSTGSEAPPPRRPAFVSFRASTVPAPPSAPAAEPSVGAPPLRLPAAPGEVPPLPKELGEGGRRWEPLLNWARQASGMAAAILMDPQGLLIASVGVVPLPDVEAIGARLMAALDYARPITPSGGIPPNVIIALDEVQLTGFEVRLPDGTALTVCLAGERPVSRALCALMESKFIEALAGTG